MLAQSVYALLAQYVGYVLLAGFPVLLALLCLSARRERRRRRAYLLRGSAGVPMRRQQTHSAPTSDAA